MTTSLLLPNYKNSIQLCDSEFYDKFIENQYLSPTPPWRCRETPSILSVCSSNARRMEILEIFYQP